MKRKTNKNHSKMGNTSTSNKNNTSTSNNNTSTSDNNTSTSDHFMNGAHYRWSIHEGKTYQPLTMWR